MPDPVATTATYSSLIISQQPLYSTPMALNVMYDQDNTDEDELFGNTFTYPEPVASSNEYFRPRVMMTPSIPAATEIIANAPIEPEEDIPYPLQLPRLPSLDPDTRTLVLFHTSMCGVMSIKDSPWENPWRSLLWPLANEHSALFHGIAAMTNFHAAKAHPSFRIEAVEHMRQAIQDLVIGLNNNMPPDVALAATMTLAFSEAWDQHTSTGIKHLKGAKILIREYMNNRRLRPQNQIADPNYEKEISRVKMLYHSWMYTDVIASLTSDQEDDGWPIETEEEEAFLRSTGDEIDPLMGCGQFLFPTIRKVAILVRKVRLSGDDKAYILEAIKLKSDLENWEPSPSIQYVVSEDPSFDVSSCIATAEAYKYASILYLYQCVPSLIHHVLPNRPPSVIERNAGVLLLEEKPLGKLAMKILELLVSIPYSSRSIVVHIFPLLSAACEVDSDSIRAVVRERWTQLERRLQLGNVDRALDVVLEVWRRKKVHNGNWKCKVGFCHWSTVMREWNWEVLLG
ncbi:fungal-specific transcription factor domain-containing protein [Dipodascopsis uninucleata]